MNETLYHLHLEAGRICGVKATCGKKNAFETEENANQAAAHHNAWDGRRHNVEPYPCYFCNKWHIGNVMSEELLREIIDKEALNEG